MTEAKHASRTPHLDRPAGRGVPRAFRESEPLGAEMPTPGQVEALLSQPLFGGTL